MRDVATLGRYKRLTNGIQHRRRVSPGDIRTNSHSDALLHEPTHVHHTAAQHEVRRRAVHHARVVRSQYRSFLQTGVAAVGHVRARVQQAILAIHICIRLTVGMQTGYPSDLAGRLRQVALHRKTVLAGNIAEALHHALGTCRHKPRSHTGHHQRRVGLVQ